MKFDIDPIPDKFVIAVIPHTSSWDFPLGLLVRSVMDIDVKYLGKDSLFKGPFGGLFRWLGGYPVDRSKNNNFVDTVIDIFKREEKFSTAIAPEGTRKKVDQLKTGFYYIAKGRVFPSSFANLIMPTNWYRFPIRFILPMIRKPISNSLTTISEEHWARYPKTVICTGWQITVTGRLNNFELIRSYRGVIEA